MKQKMSFFNILKITVVDHLKNALQVIIVSIHFYPPVKNMLFLSFSFPLLLLLFYFVFLNQS
jgi:hypothetical protein